MNGASSQSQILKALKDSTTSELIALLFRFGIADSFLKCLKEREVVFRDHSLSEPSEIHAKALSRFKEHHQLQTSEEIKAWCCDRGLLMADFESEAIHFYRAAEFRNKLLDASRESLFLRYKDSLDRVLYSLIRVSSPGLINELYYAIDANEISFGAAAAQYSVGPESKTQGLVGPVDLTVPHPEIASRLRVAQPGLMSEVFVAGEWHSLIRLEYRYESVFDDATKRFLEDVSLRTFLSREIKPDLVAIQAWLQEAA